MRFDPQSNFLSEGAQASSTSAGLLPRSGLRGQVVAFAAAVAGVLAVWIWQQSRTPAAAVGSTEPVATKPAMPTPEPIEAPGEATDDVAGGADESSASDENEQATDDAPAGIVQRGALEFSYTAEPTESQQQRADVLVRRGKRELGARRSAKAIQTLSEAVQLDPKSSDAHYNLGLAYVLAGDHRAARRQQAALRSLDPSLASLLGNLVH